MNWVFLVLAGFFEVVFAYFLKTANGFTKFLPTVLFIISSTCSLYLLSKAMGSIPIGTAYAVWTGIGAVGTVILGIFLFNDPVSFGRIFFICTLVGSIIGLKFFGGAV
jgi:quaternary ammonium compound-resistance protein SugE